MKKIVFGIALVLILSIFVVGCSSSNDNSTPNEVATTEPSNYVSEATPSPISDSTIGDYEVTIKSAKLGEDYEGNTIIVLTYDWTNNSDETAAALYSITVKAFQDGIELDYAIVMDSDVYDSGASFKEIRPGATLEVQSAFVLRNDSSDVEVEISEWISFSDDVITKVFNPNSL